MPGESQRESILERNLRKLEERYILIPGKGKILKQEYRDEGDDQIQSWKSIMKEAQGLSETPSPNATPTKEQVHAASNENKENNGDLLNEGSWNDRMNKFLFLQSFAQLLEKHGFKCNDPNFLENSEFIQSILQFFQKSGIAFPGNTGRIFIEEETEELSDSNFN